MKIDNTEWLTGEIKRIKLHLISNYVYDNTIVAGIIELKPENFDCIIAGSGQRSDHRWEDAGEYRKMKQTRILVIEDDQQIRKFIRANLEARGFEVLTAVDGEEGLKITELELPDLILLDIMMPKTDGFEVCRRIREWSKIPIIMLSARADEMDKVKCLDYGADDYMTKPFSLKELLSRVNAVLRRTREANLPPSKCQFKSGDLDVDFTSHTTKLGGEILNLTAIEDKMLRYLAINAGRVVTSNQLLEQVWGTEYFGDYRVLQVNICRLRKKLGDNPRCPRFIQTKPGIGYCLGKFD